VGLGMSTSGRMDWIMVMNLAVIYEHDLLPTQTRRQALG